MGTTYIDENGNEVSPEDLGNYDIVGEDPQIRQPSPEESTGWLGSIGNGIGRGLFSAAKPFGDLTSWYGDTFGDEAASSGGRAFSQTADEIIQQDYTDTGVDPYSAQAVVGNATSGLTNLAISGLGKVGKGATMLGIGSGLGAYDTARDEGQDYTDASLRGLGTGILDTAINRLEVAPGLSQSLSIPKRFAGTAIVNAVTNPVQTVGHELFNVGTGGDIRPVDQIAGEIVQNTAAGTVTGGVLSVLPRGMVVDPQRSNERVAQKTALLDQIQAERDALAQQQAQEPQQQLTPPQPSDQNQTVELPPTQLDIQKYADIGQRVQEANAPQDPGFTMRDPTLPPALLGERSPTVHPQKTEFTPIDNTAAVKILQDQDLIHLAQDSFSKAKRAYEQSLPTTTKVKTATDVAQESGAKTFPDLVNKDLLKPSPENEKLSQGYKLAIEADTNSLKNALPWPGDYNPTNGFKNGGPGFTILQRLKGQGGGIRRSLLGIPDPKESLVTTKDALEQADKKGLFTIADHPEVNRFLEGQVAGKYPPGSNLIAGYRKTIAFTKTITDKAGDVGKRYFDTILDGTRQAHSITYDLNKQLGDYRGLSNTERVKVNELLAAERHSAATRTKKGQAPVDLTDLDLARMGLDQKGIAGYKAVRSTMDAGLTFLRDGFLAKADSIKNSDTRALYVAKVEDWIKSMRDNKYVPFSRPGKKFSVAVSSEAPQQGADGLVRPERDLLFYGHYDTAKEAQIAARAAQSKYSETGYPTKVEIGRLASERAAEYHALPADIIEGAQKFNPDTFDQQVANGRQGFVQHLAHADLIDGYQTDLHHSIDSYIEGLGNFAAHNKTKVQVTQLLNEIPNGAFKLWATKHSADLNVSKAGPMGAVLWYLNLNYLAGVPSSAFTNLTQTLTTTVPNVLRYTKSGAPGVLKNAARDSFAVLHDKIRGTSTVDPEFRKVLDEATRRGVVDADNLKQLLDTGNKATAFRGKVDGALMFMFGAAEKANRVMALSTGYHTGKRIGKSGAELQQFAERFVDDTQFIQGKENRPAIAQSNLGKAAFMYKLFGGNYIRFLRNNMSKEGWATVGASLGSMGALGGVAAVPGINYLLKAYEAVGGDPKKKLRDLVNDKTISDGILYGIPAAAGVNISGAVGTGDLVPSVDLTNNAAMAKLFMGPAGDYGSKILKAYDLLDLKGGTSYNPRAALEQVAPRFLRNPLKTERWMREGRLLDPSGKVIVDRPPTALEAAQLTAGFTPQAITDYYEQSIGDSKFIKSNAGVTNINSKLAAAIMAGDEDLQAELVQLAAQNGQRIDNQAVKDQIKGKANPAMARVKNAPKRLRPDLLERLSSQYE